MAGDEQERKHYYWQYRRECSRQARHVSQRCPAEVNTSPVADSRFTAHRVFSQRVRHVVMGRRQSLSLPSGTAALTS